MITTEQKNIMHELLDFAIECKEAGFNLWVGFVPHVNWIVVRSYNDELVEIFNYNISFERNELTQQKFKQIKDEVLAIINEVDIKEITDKNQNIGC